MIDEYYQELSTFGYGNTIAKSISDFKESVKNRHGYYIGRYEARKNSSGSLTEVVTDSVYNSVTQPSAAIAAEDMYGEDKPFTSDLINSYAWDTAIVFEQAFDDRIDKTKPYSMQDSLNSSLSVTGTTTDKICNIYDMASNCWEWTTETYSNSSYPCVGRGGGYGDSRYGYTSGRYYNYTTRAGSDYSFRPVLYV